MRVCVCACVCEEEFPFFDVIINLFQVYHDRLQMLKENIIWVCLYYFRQEVN